jgi:NADH-quinone oxidoreductase subunit N
VIEPAWWLVILPAAATPLVYFTRRWGIGAYMAALVSLLTGWLAWNLPPTNPMRLMGRTFLLDPLTQQTMALLFVTSAVLFVAGWRLQQGWYFPPLGLVVLGLFAVAGMSRHLGITAVAMMLAAIVSVPIIQGDQAGSIRAAWRFLAMMLIALPFVLLAAWRVDAYREDIEHNAAYLGQAALFLAVGISIWLAAVPMHGWATAVGAGAPPVAAAFVLIGFPLLALVTLAHVLAEAPWFTWSAAASRWLLVVGLASAGLGGLLGAVQRNLRAVLGYAALFDLGCLLAGMAVRGPASDLAFYSGLAIRALGLTLIGIATAVIRLEAGGDALAGLGGVARRLPLASIALLVGACTLMGLPLTAGFPPRWMLLRDLAGLDPHWSWVLVAASLGIAIAYLRALAAMLAAPAAAGPKPRLAAGRWATSGLLVGLTLVSLWLGVLPAALFQLAARLIQLYPLPPP